MYHGVLEKLNTKERVNKSTINQVAIQYKRVQKRSNKKEMFDIRPKWKTIFENLDLKSWCNQIKTRNSEIERHNYEKVHIEKESEKETKITIEKLVIFSVHMYNYYFFFKSFYSILRYFLLFVILVFLFFLFFKKIN